jgi:hypothetical protein
VSLVDAVEVSVNAEYFCGLGEHRKRPETARFDATDPEPDWAGPTVSLPELGELRTPAKRFTDDPMILRHTPKENCKLSA